MTDKANPADLKEGDIFYTRIFDLPWYVKKDIQYFKKNTVLKVTKGGKFRLDDGKLHSIRSIKMADINIVKHESRKHNLINALEKEVSKLTGSTINEGISNIKTIISKFEETQDGN